MARGAAVLRGRTLMAKGVDVEVSDENAGTIDLASSSAVCWQLQLAGNHSSLATFKNV